MPRKVSYEEQTYNNPNPITRFAHRSRFRHSVDIVSQLVPSNGIVLDFGAGRGEFLKKLKPVRPDAQLMAVEPFAELDISAACQLTSLAEASDDSLDVISAMEVLEHMTDDLLTDFIRQALRTLTPGGALFVTVPIMVGLTLPVKQVSSSILRRRMPEYTAGEMVKAVWGGEVKRAENPRFSHKGFDFRKLRTTLAEIFLLEKTIFSPFPALPWWLNSQAMFIARRRR